MTNNIYIYIFIEKKYFQPILVVTYRALEYVYGFFTFFYEVYNFEIIKLFQIRFESRAGPCICRCRVLYVQRGDVLINLNKLEIY